jgi:hypothetical protein
MLGTANATYQKGEISPRFFVCSGEILFGKPLQISLTLIPAMNIGISPAEIREESIAHPLLMNSCKYLLAPH